MNLHLLWDEKIIGQIINTFEEVFPNQNIYVCLKYDNSPVKFAQEGENTFIIRNPREIPEIDFSKVSKVNIHGLDLEKAIFCNNYIPSTTPVYWHLWGAELYNVLLFERGYRLYYKSRPPFTLKQKLISIIERFGVRSKATAQIINFIRDRNVTMICSSQEYNILRKYYPKETINLKNISNYFYYPVDQILGNDLVNKKASGKIILIGNSCSWTNNHEYAFDKIRNFNLNGKTIVTPLSYGGNEEYKKEVTSLGKKYFGNSYQPLTEFLPLSQYNQLMAQAEVCIYGNWRQEAVGNILVSLYLGAKVFVSENSPIYTIYRERGLELFSLEAINEISLNTPLPDEIKKNNRDIILSRYNWERLKGLTLELFK